MSDTNVGQQPGDKSFVINAIGLSRGPERVSGQFRVPRGIVSSYGLDSRTHTGIMHRMMEQEKEKAMSGTRHETQPVATIIYENGTELTGTAVTTSDGSVGIRVPNEFFKTGLLADGSMPEGVKSVSIRPKHPKGVLPLTDDMVYMAVTASLRDAVGLPLNEAADRYESWLNRVRRDAIEKWVDSLSMRESTRLHRKYLDRDGAGHPKEEGDA